MSSCNCNYSCSCTLIAVIASAFIGIITAFLQIAGVITVTPAFLWVALGIAVGYLALTLVSTTNQSSSGCCAPLLTVLIGALGTALFALVLLAVGITATSTVSSILVGVLLFFLFLTLTATACRAKCLADCRN